MHDKDLKRITLFYEEALREYGDTDARSLHWVDAFHQALRFRVLLHVGTIDGKSLLDVGCGLGDFYKFLLKKHIDVNYTGIDIVPDFATLAKSKYPEGLFENKDIFSVTDTYDFVFASGAMSFKVENNKSYYFHMIQKMYDCCTTALAFNMLNNSTHIDNEIFAAYSPKEVADYCHTFCPHVEILTDYMDQDFTVFLYKK